MTHTINQTLRNLGLRSSAIALASCLILSGVPLAAQAAGLGKIVVFSSLGQPLRAEIEVSATREELADMKAQLASQDAFKQAGLDYATTLLGIRFSIDKRSNGQSVIKLSSDRPINDPFVDMLLEINWSAGRLVREYTFLLDPPEMAAKAAAPVTTAVARPAVATGKAPAARTPSSIDDETRAKAMAGSRAAAPTKQAERTAGGQETHEVRRGETLRRIASETKPEGVSLEQMLVGLLRANQDAFDGGNMNRLRAGKILTVPDKSTVQSVSATDAQKIVLTQLSDWNAYRGKMAGVAAQTTVKEEATRQESTGKITAKVEEKGAAASESKDQLKVTRTDTGSGKRGGAAKPSEEDLIAKEKALKEANERLGSLEKNVAELQKLIEMKNQNLAELQKQAAAKAPAPTAPPAPPVPAAAAAKVESPPPVQKADEKPVETKAAEPVAKPADVKPEPKPDVKPEVKAEPAPKPVEPVKPKPAVPVKTEGPSFFDDLLGNPMALAGGGGILALIAAYFVAKRRRAGKEEETLELTSTLSPQETSLAGNSVFRSTGGQSVDTSSRAPVHTDFSQAGPGSIDTDEVDPVAEADVYMAYGRDAQAEEILLEARQKDPKRYAIHLKLLEIYSNRKDVKQFETLATDLYGETGGVGADWEKAAAMGLKLDPANPLFGAAAVAAPMAPEAFDADATVIVSAQSLKNTLAMPGELSQLADEAATIKPQSIPVAGVDAAPVLPVEEEEMTSLDFDLGFGAPPAPAKPEPAAAAIADTALQAEPAIEAAALDFDFSIETPEPENFVAAGLETVVQSPGAGDETKAPDLDFDLGFGGGAAKETNAVPAEEEGLEFDVSLTESTFLGQSAAESPSFDISSIDLELGEPEVAVPEAAAPADFDANAVVDSSDMTFDTQQVSTAVNPEFDTEQAETIVNPRYGDEPDLLPEQDFLSAQSETVVNRQFGAEPGSQPAKEFSEAQAETLVNPQFGEELDIAPEFEISANEEVTTKLDLAKAYEEMGDFEGARELLQEVLKEGDANQREKAQSILAKISE